MSLHIKKPCKDCPFRLDSMKGWLGESRITEIIDADTFACHKTLNGVLKQCAGFLLFKGQEAAYKRVADAYKIDLELEGRELVFQDRESLIKHHSR